jgi:hypothetical protein
MDVTEFGGTFWITITGLILGAIGTGTIYCLKSKCEDCSICWGLIHIKRNVVIEVDEEKFEIERGKDPFSSQRG